MFDTEITEMSLSWPYRAVKIHTSSFSSRSASEGVTYSEELLRSGDDVSHYDGRAQGVDDVLVVGVQQQAADHLA